MQVTADRWKAHHGRLVVIVAGTKGTGFTILAMSLTIPRTRIYNFTIISGVVAIWLVTRAVIGGFWGLILGILSLLMVVLIFPCVLWPGPAAIYDGENLYVNRFVSIKKNWHGKIIVQKEQIAMVAIEHAETVMSGWVAPQPQIGPKPIHIFYEGGINQKPIVFFGRRSQLEALRDRLILDCGLTSEGKQRR